MAFELSVIKEKKRRKVWLRAFRMWQKRPYEVAAMPEELQTCASCGTEFQGNYCPRCGQAARVGRFSFKTAFLLFLDVWGVGNRGMFRSIRDLLLRPGYMIRDYLSGHQSAYFPPFKMFFLLTTFSLILSHGILSPVKEEPQKPQTEVVDKALKDGKVQVEVKGIDHVLMKMTMFMKRFNEKNPALMGFFTLVLISVPLYLFFRRSPTLPDLRYSEHLVALVYTSNMYTLYMILADCLPFFSRFIELLAVFMIFVALHQFSGYSKRRLLLYITLTMLIVFVLIASIIALIVFFASRSQ